MARRRADPSIHGYFEIAMITLVRRLVNLAGLGFSNQAIDIK